MISEKSSPRISLEERRTSCSTYLRIRRQFPTFYSENMINYSVWSREKSCGKFLLPFLHFSFWRERGEGGNIESFWPKRKFSYALLSKSQLSSFGSLLAKIFQLLIISLNFRFNLILKVNSTKIFNASFAIFGSFSASLSSTFNSS